MGVGGATWDTAGTLELGSGNTFDRADATEDGDILNEVGWWTFTVTSPTQVTLAHNAELIIYTGAAEVDKVRVDEDFDDDGNPTFVATDGVEYHVQVGIFSTGPTTYVVTYSQTVLAVSPWITTLRDRTDNEVIVSRLELVQSNQNGFFRTFPEWMLSVVRWLGVDSARGGQYSATEVLGGDDPNGAEGCCWAHAAWGEFDGQLWSGIEQDPDIPSMAVCFPLGSTAAANSSVLDPSYAVQAAGPPPGVFIARIQSATVVIVSRAIYYLPVRDNTGPFGGLAFASPDPYEDGVPASAENITLEFESPHCDLLGVDFTGDFTNRTVTADAGNEGRVALRDLLARPFAPSDETHGTYDTYTVGTPGDWDGTGAGYLSSDYDGGVPADWVPIDGAASGDDGWDGKADYTSEDCDEHAVVGMRAHWGDTASEQGEHTTDLDIALRFRLRSPRYRWIYTRTTPAVIPPRRIFQRSDGATHGARRVGAGNTRQSGSRTLGAIL